MFPILIPTLTSRVLESNHKPQVLIYSRISFSRLFLIIVYCPFLFYSEMLEPRRPRSTDLNHSKKDKENTMNHSKSKTVGPCWWSPSPKPLIIQGQRYLQRFRYPLSRLEHYSVDNAETGTLYTWVSRDPLKFDLQKMIFLINPVYHMSFTFGWQEKDSLVEIYFLIKFLGFL